MSAMIRREPAFYRNFQCQGGACPDTCCQDWEIVVDEEYMAQCPDELREDLEAGTAVDEEGDRCFRLTSEGRCVFLNREGLCSIQRRWGAECLSEHCAAYPRFIEEYGCLTEMNLAVSCPEAARLTMERGIFPLLESDDGAGEPPFEGVDGALLSALTASRKTALALLGERAVPLWTRLGVLVDYAAALQERIDEGRFDAMARCPLPQSRSWESAGTLCAQAVRLLDFLAGLNPLRPEWPSLLKKRAGELSALSSAEYGALTGDYVRARPQWEAHLERLAQALLFRHWPKTVNDGELYGRAGFAAAACVVLHHLSMLAWREDGCFSNADECLLWARFSREVEHDEDNFRRVLENLLWSPGAL